jgi:hypothetical protein
VAHDLAAIEEAVYDESFRTLAQQALVLDGLRARAGAILTAANVSTAFLGGLAFSHEDASGGSHGTPLTEIPGLVMICLFVVVVFLSLLAITPSRRWVVAHHPHDLLAEYVDPGPQISISEFRRTISYYNGINYDANSRQLRLLVAVLTAASVCLGSELVLALGMLVR